MRVATFVLGIGIALSGGLSEASDSISSGRISQGSFGEGGFAAPTDRFITRNAQDGSPRNDAVGAMAYVPSQSQPSFLGSGFAPIEPAVRPPRKYNPANVPLPKTRTLEDHLLTGFVALMLIAYQLRRKHRFLRPHQFST